MTKKVSLVFEADIRSYFTRIDHQWLRRMVAHRIADPIILRLLSKWLKAGAMHDGVFIPAKEGTPQGGPISPVLSNIYLHFTLDLWFEKKFKPQCRGEAYLVRFADDFVGCFQFQEDAQNFQRQLRERFAQFNLELAEEKTRLLLFGRFAASMRGKHGQRPETFEFLGFKHVCGVDRSGRFAVIRIPSTKSCRKFLARTREWLLEHRHWKRREQQQHLTVMLRGFYQYFALHHCDRKLSWIRHEIQRQWKQALQRRGQRRRLSWERLGDRSGSSCRSLTPCIRRSEGDLRECHLGSPVREICTPGSAWGDEFKKPCRLGEGTGAKASATVRLRKGYRFKARLYHPVRPVGPPLAPHQGHRRHDRGPLCG